MKFAFIHEHRATFSTALTCEALGVSRSGYHAWVDRPESAQTLRRRVLAAKIDSVHEENRRVYGSPRVCKVLQGRGESVCENTVAKVMKERGIKAKTAKKFVPRTTDSAHGRPVADNVLGRRFAAEAPNQKWAVDLTYVSTDEGWLYLAGVIDLCSRKIVGWSMADHMRSELTSAALAMAVTQRRPLSGVLHHSDRGVQYACDDYQKLLDEHEMTPSMSGKGDCWDNAVTESFWGTLKTELVQHEHYATREQARQSIFEYIEVFYNRKRLHSSIGYRSPEAFEASLD